MAGSARLETLCMLGRCSYILACCNEVDRAHALAHPASPNFSAHQVQEVGQQQSQVHAAIHMLRMHRSGGWHVYLFQCVRLCLCALLHSSGSSWLWTLPLVLPQPRSAAIRDTLMAQSLIMQPLTLLTMGQGA